MKIVFVETITHEVDTDDYRRSLRASIRRPTRRSRRGFGTGISRSPSWPPMGGSRAARSEHTDADEAENWRN